ncbi:hypothetical protein E3O44_12725 [Cryobacterium algoricola]|uniref:NlpC/P60 domain-containing protein n=1 Tax=Cryobacterium algoricola TaxID=1259183 RepID=A0ABY2ID81_9MICO|nr:peptidoglycan amidohydrolase family protein [Cryobacterium algoricola]TFB85860.1 hypothetical protein E3O44_12725 [Cryobacterium algoricola]
MKSIDQQIQWLQDKQNQGITYSMAQRNGPDSYDCSSAGYYSLIAGGFFPADIRIGNTDSAFGDLERNGFTQLQPNAQGNYDTQRGDVAIWGKRGASSGGLGHFMTFTDANNVKHCNSYYNGIHDNNYDQLAGWNGNPEVTFYRYTGSATQMPPAASGNPDDQSVDIGSFIKFADNLTVNDVEQIGGTWQVKSDSLCPTGFTWDDNGIPAELLIEVDADGYATIDQELVAGSQYKLPGKFQVLDLGLTDGQWMALISWNGLKFWVDIAAATEVSTDDGGTPTPGARPTEPVATPAPEAPVETAPSIPEPANPVVAVPTVPLQEPAITTPAKETNEVKETPMAFKEEEQKQLAVAQTKVQDLVDSVAADESVQTIISEIPQKIKVGIYIVGDALIGLGLIAPSLAVVAGWTDVVRIVALSSVLATAGAFILTMFGIYQSKK